MLEIVTLYLPLLVVVAFHQTLTLHLLGPKNKKKRINMTCFNIYKAVYDISTKKKSL